MLQQKLFSRSRAEEKPILHKPRAFTETWDFIRQTCSVTVCGHSALEKIFSIPFICGKELRWLRAARREHQGHLPQGNGFRYGALCMEKEPGVCIFLGVRGDTREAQGSTRSEAFRVKPGGTGS